MSDIDELVKDLRLRYCSCHEGYTSRNMIDPHCESCNTLEERFECADALERQQRDLKEAVELLERAEAQIHGASNVFNDPNFTDRGRQGPGLRSTYQAISVFLARVKP
jgi:hypothetical protein